MIEPSNIFHFLFRGSKSFHLNYPEGSHIINSFIIWTFLRAVLHRGWWLVTSLYFVIVAELTPSELILIGVWQGIISFLVEIPAGVVADTISRKYSLVLSQVLMGIAMITTGLVVDFYIIVLTQMLWGISWAFASGADVAWVTDELQQPEQIHKVLVKSARAQLLGSAVGLVGIGLLAWWLGLGTAMVIAGSAMLLLGGYIAIRFTEMNFTPTKQNRWKHSFEILKEGFLLAKTSRTILLIFLVTFVINGAAEIGRVYPKQLTEVGFPEGSPVVWFTVINIVSLLLGVLVLQIIEHRAHSVKTAKKDYATACVIGAIGLLALAYVPLFSFGFIGILLMDGIKSPITRTLATIQVNSISADKTRATIHSFLAQIESLGEVILGALIAFLAGLGGLPVAFTSSAVLLVVSAVLMVFWKVKNSKPA